MLLYRGKRTGFRLTLQNIFIFLFLGIEAQAVPYVGWREDNKWNADVILLQL